MKLISPNMDPYNDRPLKRPYSKKNNKNNMVLDTAEMVMNPMAENNKSPTKQIPYLLYDQGKEHRQKNPTSFQFRFSMLEGGCRVHQNLIICPCFMHLHLASSNPSHPNPKSVTEAKPVESDDSILRVNNYWSDMDYGRSSSDYFKLILFCYIIYLDRNSISPARNSWICKMFRPFERKKRGPVYQSYSVLTFLEISHSAVV